MFRNPITALPLRESWEDSLPVSGCVQQPLKPCSRLLQPGPCTRCAKRTHSSPTHQGLAPLCSYLKLPLPFAGADCDVSSPLAHEQWFDHVTSLYSMITASLGCNEMNYTTVTRSNVTIQTALGARGNVVVKVLCYKPEGCGFETRCNDELFQFVCSFRPHWALGFTQPPTEMSIRIPLG
jgi:hypothetical protein